MSNLVTELRLLCIYIMAVANSTMPDQLKWELIFNENVYEKIKDQISIGDIYGYEGLGDDWPGHGPEVAEFAAVIEKLLDDLDKVQLPEDLG